MERYRNYPRIVGETGGKDFIVAHPSADVESLAAAIVRGSFEYQGQKCSASSRVYAPSNLWPELRERLQEEVATIKMGDVADFSNFMGAVIDSSSFATQARGDRGGEGERRQRHRRRRRLRRLAGLLRRADGDRDARPRLPAAARGDLRAGRDDVRLRREQVGRHARARRPHRSLRPDRRRLLAGSRGCGGCAGQAPLRGGQLLRQRQANRRGRRAAAVRRRARVGHERQGRLDVEPDPLGQPALDQGDVRAAEDYRYPFLDGPTRQSSSARRRRA